MSASIRPFEDLEQSTNANKAQLIAARRELLDLDTPRSSATSSGWVTS
ncbi:hypothetical protein NKG05_23355 [Oerskovia sp. M15]